MIAFGGKTKTKTKPKTDSATKPKSAVAPPWNVIVKDDPVTLMSYVTKVFRQGLWLLGEQGRAPHDGSASEGPVDRVVRGA